MDNAVLGQGDTSTYLGCKILYEEEKYRTWNISTFFFLQILLTEQYTETKYSPKIISIESI
jgi:hypothetical protein